MTVNPPRALRYIGRTTHADDPLWGWTDIGAITEDDPMVWMEPSGLRQGMLPEVCTDPDCTITLKPGRPVHGPHSFRAADQANDMARQAGLDPEAVRRAFEAPPDTTWTRTRHARDRQA